MPYLGRSEVLFGNNKKVVKLFELPGLEQDEVFVFVRSKGSIFLPRLRVPEQVSGVKNGNKG